MSADGLSVALHPEGASLPEQGSVLQATGGMQARLTTAGVVPRVSLVMPDRPVAELRWLVDQVLRGVRKVLDLQGRVSLEVAEGVPDAVARAVALDLHNATKGTLAHSLGTGLDRVAASEDLYRAWVDEDPTTRTSVAIARDVREWAAGVGGVDVDIFGGAELERMGMGLLLAVGGASEVSPPRLVVARYRPEADEGSAPLMLLGKGITFDSGGINVKPYESFVSMMKNDMAGAALSYALFRHLVETNHPRPLLLVIPTCENPVGEGAMRPGALVRGYAGKVVRIDHTDAEGRLILADALAYASERYQPRQVISFATLTTAALTAYGPYATPVHFPSPDLERALQAASVETGEDLHFFPRRVWHFEANRDVEADVKNTARLPGHAKRAAGSRNAGHFLLHFTDRPLTHFDIFGCTWNWAGDAPGSGSGATGAPLRTLIAALSSMTPEC